MKNADHPPAERVIPLIRNYQHVTQASWKDDLESLIPFDKILLQDPADAYGAMDLESRNVYREKVAQIAQRSDLTELEVAEEALALARKAQKRGSDDPRIAQRESHIGYYLVSEGATLLCQRVGYHPTSASGSEVICAAHPDEYLLFGIAVLTFVIITGVVWILTAAVHAAFDCVAFDVVLCCCPVLRRRFS